jgi:hypothetical protein
MKIHPEYKPELVTHPIVEKCQHPMLFTADAAVVATDGSMLVVVPVEVESGDVSGPLQARVFEEAHDLDGVAESVSVKAGDFRVSVDDDVSFRRVQLPIDCKFPDWKAVLPTFKRGDSGTVSVALDSKKLDAIHEALRRFGNYGVVLTFKVDGTEAALEPILVNLNNAEHIDAEERQPAGLLMPCRIERAREEESPALPQTSEATR